MNGFVRRLRPASAVAAVLVLVCACASPPTGQDPPPPGQAPTSSAGSTSSPSTTYSTTTSPTTTTSVENTARSATATTASSVPRTQTEPPVSIVTEGVECGPRGAVAAFADGATAYCARLQYTDGAAWSRDPALAPNPAAEESFRQSGPQIGDRCIGAEIGLTAVDAYGNAILCDNYRWVLNVGQEPRHPWVDDQIEWTECLEQFTQEECQEMHN